MRIISKNQIECQRSEQSTSAVSIIRCCGVFRVEFEKKSKYCIGEVENDCQCIKSLALQRSYW